MHWKPRDRVCFETRFALLSMTLAGERCDDLIPAHADADSLGIPKLADFRINAAMTNRMAEVSDGLGGEDYPDGLHERTASRA